MPQKKPDICICPDSHVWLPYRTGKWSLFGLRTAVRIDETAAVRQNISLLGLDQFQISVCENQPFTNIRGKKGDRMILSSLQNTSKI